MAVSRLKSFEKISPSSWDVVSKITVGKSEEPCDLLNIERNYPEKIKRTYCKCGYASGKIEEVCPECGNKNHKKFEFNGSRTSNLLSIKRLALESVKTSSGTYEDRVIGYKNDITEETDEVAKEFVFKESGEQEVFEIGEEEAVSYLPTGRYTTNFDFDYKEVSAMYPYDTDGLDKINGGNTVSGLISYVENKIKYPVLISNVKKYPGIVNYILSDSTELPKYSMIKTWDEVYTILNVPEPRLYPYVESLASSERSYSRYYGYSCSGSLKNAFEEYKKLDSDMKVIADYFLMHGGCDANTFKELTKTLNSMDTSEANVILNFVRMNYVSYGAEILRKYIEHRKFLLDEGLDINIANMDTRNYNLLKNKKHIVENQRYNEKRVSYFLEMFDLNPLESLKYLDSRRAPNKDLRAELAKKLD